MREGRVRDLDRDGESGDRRPGGGGGGGGVEVRLVEPEREGDRAQGINTCYYYYTTPKGWKSDPAHERRYNRQVNAHFFEQTSVSSVVNEWRAGVLTLFGDQLFQACYSICT